LSLSASPLNTLELRSSSGAWQHGSLSIKMNGKERKGTGASLPSLSLSR
jgi:hypothetical protein